VLCVWQQSTGVSTAHKSADAADAPRPSHRQPPRPGFVPTD
jgi:hypothetical protein